VPNPRLVCPGGSLKYSAIEPVLLGEWEEVPEAFARIPITCFQAVLRAAENFVSGEDSAKSLGLAASATWVTAGPCVDAALDDPTAWSDNHGIDNWEALQLEGSDQGGAEDSEMVTTTAVPAVTNASSSRAPLACVGWSPAGETFDLSTGADSSVMATRQLEEILRQHGRKLVPTPLDGSCLLRALHLTTSRGFVVTIEELRQQALAQAQPEQLEIAAGDRGMTAEEYRARMMQPGARANDLVVGLLALSQQMAITVVSPAYVCTWTAAGKQLPGHPGERSLWIACDGSNHFRATAPL